MKEYKKYLTFYVNDNVDFRIVAVDDILKQKEIKKYEVLLKKWVGEWFLKDFGGEKISNHTEKEKIEVLLIMIQQSNIFNRTQKTIGGAVLATGRTLNQFIDPIKERKIKEYQEKKFINVSYFFIKKKYRGNNIGKQGLNIMMDHCNNNLWLSAADRLLPFYGRNGYDVIIRKIENESSSLLLCSKVKDV